jgi:hypothetical protein
MTLNSSKAEFKSKSAEIIIATGYKYLDTYVGERCFINGKIEITINIDK